jgi:hypothetical protein
MVTPGGPVPRKGGLRRVRFYVGRVAHNSAQVWWTQDPGAEKDARVQCQLAANSAFSSWKDVDADFCAVPLAAPGDAAPPPAQKEPTEARTEAASAANSQILRLRRAAALAGGIAEGRSYVVRARMVRGSEEGPWTPSIEFETPSRASSARSLRAQLGRFYAAGHAAAKSAEELDALAEEWKDKEDRLWIALARKYPGAFNPGFTVTAR